MGITVGLLGLSEKLRTILSQLKKNKGRGYKDESLAVDVVYVVLPPVHTVGVLLQPDLLVIGHAVEDCCAGHGVRSKDMNGLAEMKRSQVTHVPLVFGTFKRALVLHQYSV